MKYKETKVHERGTGRTGIGHLNRTSRSLRAASGKIEVVRKPCLKCGHHKWIQNNTLGPVVGKCSRCGFTELA